MGILDKLFKPNIQSLKARGDSDALFAALKDMSLREEAARALEELGEVGRWQPFAAALADEDRFVRQAARRMFDKQKILDSLAEFLQKWRKWEEAGPDVDKVKVAAAGALFLELVEADTIGRRADGVDRTTHIDLLVQALENPYIGMFAIKACGATKEPATIRPLITLAKRDSLFLEDVLATLRRITNQDLGNDLDAWLNWAGQQGF